MYKHPKIFQKYEDLLQKHKNPKEFWPQWCTSTKSEELMQLVAIGSILVQRTSWSNAEKALKNLKAANLISIKTLSQIDINKLTKIIGIAGFYTTKPKRLVELCKFTLNNYGSFENMKNEKDIALIRQKLLEVYGIGPETADTILLFVLGKPSFIVDTYTKRFVEKHSLFNIESDEEIKKMFEENLPKDPEIFRNYHVLKILDQRPKDKCYMEIV